MFDVDWRAAEELLFSYCLAQFPEIAAKHPDEEFYGVFFDCDVVYTCAQVHMNTNALLRTHAERCMSEDRQRDLPLYAGMTLEEVMEESRWDGGSWGYFPMLAGPEFKDVAAAYQELLKTCEGSEGDLLPLREEFMLMACRAVVRIEKSGVFDLFQKSSDFRVICVYIQENLEEGEERLRRIRSSFKVT